MASIANLKASIRDGKFELFHELERLFEPIEALIFTEGEIEKFLGQELPNFTCGSRYFKNFAVSYREMPCFEIRLVARHQELTKLIELRWQISPRECPPRVAGELQVIFVEGGIQLPNKTITSEAFAVRDRQSHVVSTPQRDLTADQAA